MATVTADPERDDVVRRGVRLSVATFAYNLLEGMVAIVAGVMAGSVALVGSTIGIVLAALSLVIMPLLARAKHRVAIRMGSGALAAEAQQTSLCAYLSAILLGGLALNATLGWWWADPIAALVMVPIIAKEGAEGCPGFAMHSLMGHCPHSEASPAPPHISV
jgi:hypothetical protein